MIKSIPSQKIKKLDKSNLLGSIELLDKQCEQTWKEIKKIKVPRSYRRIENIVAAGMGGSALGTHIVKSIYADMLKMPLEIVRDYTLPGYVGPKTLLILSSYSGNTEETLAAAKEGLRRKAKIIGIATGGELSKFFKKNKSSAYLFQPKHNPSDQPRMSLGYLILGQLGLLKQCGLLKINEQEIKNLIKFLRNKKREFRINAQKIVPAFYGRTPIFVASEFLLGNAHVFANQINENAKCFAAYFELPELNHHLMEGLKNPTSNRKNLKFFLFDSVLYHPRNQKRYKILKEVLRKNKIDFAEYQPKSRTKLLQAFELLLLGSYISFYLAMIYNLDPTPIPWVNFFKERLE